MRILPGAPMNDIMKRSTASLQERLANWTDWDGVCYEVGACLGFWPEFGSPNGDSWHGVKGIIWSNNPLGESISMFIDGLVLEGMLERRDDSEYEFRWNPNYKRLSNE